MGPISASFASPIFSATIAENIAYARPGASDAELVAAAQAANAHEFIVHLPRGYETQVGERGIQLSGGQRQRIAIARAFLADSPVLILDEPTSAVDTEAEAAIVDAIGRLMHGRTVILITHRSSLLQSCTAVLVIENGRVLSETTPIAPVAIPRPRPTPDRAQPVMSVAPVVSRRSTESHHAASGPDPKTDGLSVGGRGSRRRERDREALVSRGRPSD